MMVAGKVRLLPVALKGWTALLNTHIMTKLQQLHHRFEMINDDLEKLREFISENGLGEKFYERSKCCDNAWTHINNIEIACDLNNDESLSWKRYGTSKLTDDESEKKRFYNNVHNTNY